MSSSFPQIKLLTVSKLLPKFRKEKLLLQITHAPAGTPRGTQIIASYLWIAICPLWMGSRQLVRSKSTQEVFENREGKL